MIGFGNEELDKAPPITRTIECPHCGELHEVKESITSWSTHPEDIGKPGGIHYYVCQGTTYLAGIDGKLITGMLK